MESGANKGILTTKTFITIPEHLALYREVPVKEEPKVRTTTLVPQKIVDEEKIQASIEISPPEEGSTMDEIIVMESVQEMTKRFVKDYLIVWCDPNVNSKENMQYREELQAICDVKVFTDWNEASEYIEGTKAFVHVITSGTNGELLIKKISDLTNMLSIYIFCSNVDDYHSQLAKGYKKIIFIGDKFSNLISEINKYMSKWQKKSSSLRVDFPAFAPIFDDMDKSDNNHLHLYLKALTKFENRSQAKRDLLALAKAIYRDKKNISDFEKSYTQYSMEAILHWYTKECFLYKITNNCLRIATSDAIQYCRLALKDLENAIKEQYQKKSKHYNGLLYRGAYISSQEWTKLQQNIGKEIEMYGFLSTSKAKSVAIVFAQSDVENKAFITIIIPGAPDKGEQGFAEVKEFSEFDCEEEVLFNVRSRFTILGAATEEIEGEKCRHLVLLYGAEALRRYITESKPVIEKQISDLKGIGCDLCWEGISLAEECMIFTNLSGNTQHFCSNCIQDGVPYGDNQKQPLLCIPSSNQVLRESLQKNTMDLKIPGMIMQYQKDFDISYYGYKCAKCPSQQTKSNSYYFKCSICQESRKTWCPQCFFKKDNNEECIKKGHLIILETHPFTFWSEKMSAKESAHANYQKKSAYASILFQQADAFYNTHEYGKAVKYFEKFLEKNKKDNDKAIAATSYNELGLAYKELGQYQKALECHENALKIHNALYGDKHQETATSYNYVGLAYNMLGQEQKATEYLSKSMKIWETSLEAGQYQQFTGTGEKLFEIVNLEKNKNPLTVTLYNKLGLKCEESGQSEKAVEYYLKALEISKSVYGDKFPETAITYNNLGLAHDKLEQPERAIEYHKSALEIWKLVYGDKDPSTAASYNNLGSSYYKLGQYQEAIEHNLNALKIQKLVHGDRHPETATSYHHIGLSYFELGQYQKAADYCLNALEIRKLACADKPLEIAKICTKLGLIYDKLEQFKEAEEQYSKTLVIHKSVYGDKHPKTATSYFRLATTYSILGEAEKGLETHLKALEIRKSVYGDNHEDTAESLKQVGFMFEGLGLHQKAVECHLAVLKTHLAIFGNKHPETAGSYNHLGAACLPLRMYEKAIECHLCALITFKNLYGEKHSETATSYYLLGTTYSISGEYQKAVENLTPGFILAKLLYGENHPNTIDAYQCLIGAMQRLQKQNIERSSAESAHREH